jgi:hypothetical protein
MDARLFTCLFPGLGFASPVIQGLRPPRAFLVVRESAPMSSTSLIWVPVKHPLVSWR